jgi:phosphatidylglycerophosphate synthase
MDIVRTLALPPNLITLSRLPICWFVLALYRSSPEIVALLVILSLVLDILDGNVARYFGQCSRLGAFFDMILDRTSDFTYFAILAISTDSEVLRTAYIILCGIEYLGSALQMANACSTQNKTKCSTHWLLGYFYSNSWFFFSVVWGAEFFFAAHMVAGTNYHYRVIWGLTFVTFVMK